MRKCLTVAIIGAANVGKSSLLNRLVGAKNSIVSPRPHTTRHTILGVMNCEETQVVFIDTPGYVKKGTSIWAEHFISSVKDALENVDLIILLLDATRYTAPGSCEMLQSFASNEKTIIALSKLDLRARGRLYHIVSEVAGYGYSDTVFLVSSKTGAGIEDLKSKILSRATEREWLLDDNDATKLPMGSYAAECVREKAFHCLYDEVPFYLWTLPTKWKMRQKNDSTEWYAEVRIVVSRDSHKKIVIGRSGECIKRIGIAARTELESIWGKGQLFLDVVVDKDWLYDREKVRAICMGVHGKVG